MSPDLQNRIRKLSLQLADSIDAKNKHFSFIVRQKSILAIGWANGFKTHPQSMRLGYQFSGIHSELAAIKQLGFNYDFSSCLLVNTRVMRHSPVLGLSKPCSICYPWVNTLGFREVWWSNNEDKYECNDYV